MSFQLLGIIKTRVLNIMARVKLNACRESRARAFMFAFYMLREVWALKLEYQQFQC